MSDLKKSTVSEHLLEWSRQTGSTGEPYQQNVPRLKLPLVPYELGLVQGSIFENPEQISRVEATPVKNRPGLPYFAVSALGPERIPESVQTEMSLPPVPGRNVRARLLGTRGQGVNRSSLDVGVGPFDLHAGQGTGGTTLAARASGNLPGNRGRVSGSYETTSFKSPDGLPGLKLKRLQGNWTGSLGDNVRANFQAGAIFPKFDRTRLPNQYNIGARAVAKNPFGIGGTLSGDAGVNLRPGKDNYSLRARYTLPFGGSR